MNQEIIAECRASEARNWLCECEKRINEARELGRNPRQAQIAYLRSIREAIEVVRGSGHANKMLEIMSAQYFVYPNRWPNLWPELMRNINLGVAA